MISEKTNSATDFIKKYEDISKSVNNQKNQLKELKKKIMELENKNKEPNELNELKELKELKNKIPGLGSKKIF